MTAALPCDSAHSGVRAQAGRLPRLPRHQEFLCFHPHRRVYHAQVIAASVYKVVGL
ncbi:hypothetical protein OsJ_31510 [Oryza sativa Japonica Group]|uniref:Uncharacterized protein n=3 Tax=Oryza TaxID=4527 RepID=A0A8J8XQE1_ORYSJ|nr:hypothetical protein LOC_Os10g27440 [Oryza sativa Japonica Group]EAZ16069.1 hypothetical protein OsJ_31510 [Oryza sativa Japonica Group]